MVVKVEASEKRVNFVGYAPAPYKWWLEQRLGAFRLEVTTHVGDAVILLQPYTKFEVRYRPFRFEDMGDFRSQR